MRHIPNLEQPALAPDTENEVYHLEWIARDILQNEDLRQSIKTHRKLVVDTKAGASDLSFAGDEAQMLLTGLRQVTDTLPIMHPRRQAALAMVAEYDAQSVRVIDETNLAAA